MLPSCGATRWRSGRAAAAIARSPRRSTNAAGRRLGAAAGRRGRSCGSCAEPKTPLQPGQLARFVSNRLSYSSKLLRQPAPPRLRGAQGGASSSVRSIATTASGLPFSLRAPRTGC
jgi:hypothetical protein